jgi:putative oxidoreductase
MKTFLHNDYVIAALRIILGVIFVFASIDKIADPIAFASSIANYKLVGSSVGMVVATILPWLELLCGMSLILGTLPKGSSLLVFFMMLVFTVAVLSGIARGLDITCGCFSKDPTVGRIGWMKVFENLVLIVLSWFVLVSKSDKFTFTRSSN